MLIRNLKLRSQLSMLNQSALLLTLLTGCGRQTSEQRGLQGYVPGNLAVLTIAEMPSYNYGNVEIGSTREHFFTVVNTGTSRASQMSGSFYLTMNFRYKGSSYPGTDGTCGAGLDAGQTCNIRVEYVPQTDGSHSTGLILTYFNGLVDTSTSDTMLYGHGRMPPTP